MSIPPPLFFDTLETERKLNEFNYDNRFADANRGAGGRGEPQLSIGVKNTFFNRPRRGSCFDNPRRINLNFLNATV